MLPRDSEICHSKLTKASSAFNRLPEEIILQILQQTSPNGFASLVLLNRRWRLVSSQAHLYIHQLLRCSSYSASHHSFRTTEQDNYNLPRLRRTFAREIKRNLFEAYLRPSETTINLISKSNGKSSSERESLHYSLSPQGHYILAYSSYCIHVLDATGQEILVKREFKILQRPILVTITDDGHFLATFSSDLRVDIYDLREQQARHIRTIVLDHTPRTIALSPNGSVLAVAYDSGIEVSSLNPTSFSTDRRSVKCYTVDSLSFSRDGTQILGTTIYSQSPSTVVLTAPYFDTGAALPEDSISALWTTSILFPNGSRDCSHAILLPTSSGEEANWAFTYDRSFETFRAVRIDDLRNGTTYFTRPVANSSAGPKLIPSSLPSVNKSGELVASGFHGSIWIYGIPEALDTTTSSKNGTYNSKELPAQTPPIQSLHNENGCPLKLSNIQRDEISKIPQWQLLCDRDRNTFVEGRNIAFFDNVSDIAWVNSLSFICGDRLIAVASGTVSNPTTKENDSSIPVNEGRIMILDFNHSPKNGKKKSITIDLGVNKTEILDKEDQYPEIELTRDRMQTLSKQRGISSQILLQDLEDSSANFSQRSLSLQLSVDKSDIISTEDAFDTPYSHTSPRSGSTLRRAATAAAMNRRLNPRLTSSSQTLEYRRADGRDEYPHESDADDWVPPPPPYSHISISKLPDYHQKTFPEHGLLKMQALSTICTPSADASGIDTDIPSMSLNDSSSTENILGESGLLSDFHDSNTRLISLSKVEGESQHVINNFPNDEFDDLYDVSPSVTPPPESQQFNLVMSDDIGASKEMDCSENTNPTPTISSKGQIFPIILQQPGLGLLFAGDCSSRQVEINDSNRPVIMTSRNQDQARVSKNSKIPQSQKVHNSQNLTSKFENKGEKHPLKLPFSNKIASVAKSLRDQNPKLARRSTAPEFFSSFIPITTQSSNLSTQGEIYGPTQICYRSDNFFKQKRLSDFSDYNSSGSPKDSLRHKSLDYASLQPSLVSQQVLDQRLGPNSCGSPSSISSALQCPSVSLCFVQNDKSQFIGTLSSIDQPETVYKQLSTIEINTAVPTTAMTNRFVDEISHTSSRDIGISDITKVTSRKDNLLEVVRRQNLNQVKGSKEKKCLMM